MQMLGQACGDLVDMQGWIQDLRKEVWERPHPIYCPCNSCRLASWLHSFWWKGELGLGTEHFVLFCQEVCYGTPYVGMNQIYTCEFQSHFSHLHPNQSYFNPPYIVFKISSLYLKNSTFGTSILRFWRREK